MWDAFGKFLEFEVRKLEHESSLIIYLILGKKLGSLNLSFIVCRIKMLSLLSDSWQDQLMYSLWKATWTLVKWCNIKLLHCWASLMAQWLQILLPMQETWVWSPVWEDHTCHKATKPVCHSCWACALEPRNRNCWAHTLQLLKPTCPPQQVQPL